jgi:hypothetical protein
MIAVVDVAARWLNEQDGEEYAYALLGAVTDGPTQLRVYGELVGAGPVDPPRPLAAHLASTLKRYYQSCSILSGPYTWGAHD